MEGEVFFVFFSLVRNFPPLPRWDVTSPHSSRHVLSASRAVLLDDLGDGGLPLPSSSFPHSSVKGLSSKFGPRQKLRPVVLWRCCVGCVAAVSLSTKLMFIHGSRWFNLPNPPVSMPWKQNQENKWSKVSERAVLCFSEDYLFECVHLKTRAWLTNSSVKKTREKSKVKETSPGNWIGVCDDACWYSGGFKPPWEPKHVGGGKPALLSRGFRAASDISVWERGGRREEKKEETGSTACRHAGQTSHRSDEIFTAGWNVSGSARCLIFQLEDALNSSARQMKSLFL